MSDLKNNYPSHLYSENLREWFIPVEKGKTIEKYNELKEQGKFKILKYAMGYGLFAVLEEDEERWNQAQKS
jgi:hypothetical protein